MTYNSQDYQVISTYTGGLFKEDILNGATISVKGAIFQIEREYTRRGVPTRIFKFTSFNEFVDGDSTKELIEIGWNTCSAGFIQIAKELGLDYQSGSSYFSSGNAMPHFVEVVE